MNVGKLLTGLIFSFVYSNAVAFQCAENRVSGIPRLFQEIGLIQDSTGGSCMESVEAKRLLVEQDRGYQIAGQNDASFRKERDISFSVIKEIGTSFLSKNAGFMYSNAGIDGPNSDKQIDIETLKGFESIK